MILKYLALVLCALPSAHATTTFTILDQYSGSNVPTGTSYERLTYYNQYVDATSVDASPFVIDKLTPHAGGILFFNSTELNSGGNANTFRLTSTTGLFDFISFKLQNLESFEMDATASMIPTITITSNTGSTQSFSAIGEEYSFEYEPGEFDTSYNYSFEHSGVKTMNWTDVTWVDFTTQHTKAKTSDYVLEISVVPEPSSVMLIGGLLMLGLTTRRRKSKN